MGAGGGEGVWVHPLHPPPYGLEIFWFSAWCSKEPNKGGLEVARNTGMYAVGSQWLEPFR